MSPRRNYLVYLSGPIAGLTFDQAQDWRLYVQKSVRENIRCLDPLRGKEFLRSTGILDGSFYDHPLASPRGITCRDHWDTERSDIILVNLLGASKISIGTAMEIAWAKAYSKPVVAAIEQNNPHTHPILTQCLDYVLPTLDEAIDTLHALTVD
jgi:nucleoside 2-deoxyribosyltransferase